MTTHNKNGKVDKKAFGKNISAFGSIFSGILHRGAHTNANNVKGFAQRESRAINRVQYPKLHPTKGYKSVYHRK